MERGRRTIYNRYIPKGNTYTRVVEQDGPSPGWTPVGGPPMGGPPGGGSPPPPPSSAPPSSAPPPRFPWGELSGGLGGILKKLKLDNWDSGDILLLLIVLFLLLEGDNLELAIALGLVLIMGLGDDKEQKPDPYGA